MGNNYMPNRIVWSRGDMVLAEYDAKEPKMLIQVDSVEDGMVDGHYLDSRLRTRYPQLLFPLEDAHDPAKFAVPTQQKAIDAYTKPYYYREAEEKAGFREHKP